jgi:DNA-directed RNA polymerase subunit RPC12/RpoP
MENFNKNCPGSASFREPLPETIFCPKCGAEVEIWSDERMAKCRSCGSPVMKDRGASCLEWCKMAKECVGPEAYERFLAGKAPVASESQSQPTAPVSS